MASKYFNKVKGKINPESKEFISMSLDIIDQVYYILKESGITQRELAEKLSKSESEISKWLSGGHNITLKTLAKLKIALGTDIITTPLRNAGNYYTSYQEQDLGTAKIVRLNPKGNESVEYSDSIEFEKTSNNIAL